MELKEIIKELTEIRNEALYQLDETDILGAKFEINKLDTLLYKMQKSCDSKPETTSENSLHKHGVKASLPLSESEVYEVMRPSYVEADKICRNGHKTSARKMSSTQFLEIMHNLKMRLLGNEP